MIPSALTVVATPARAQNPSPPVPKVLRAETCMFRTRNPLAWGEA